MSPARLLEHFDRIAEAPGAIPRLRRFILDLAVRGKLVEQDPNDEPANTLLASIEHERVTRAQTKRTRNGSSSIAVTDEEKWFQIPSSWTWVRLSQISQVIMGQSPPGDTYNKYGDGVPLINGPVEFSIGPFGKTIVSQYTTAPTNYCEEGDLLICVRGSTTGRTNIAGFRACIGRGVAAIRPLFTDDYIRLFIWRMREYIIAMGRGIAFPSVSRQQIEELPTPLPPLAEQHRIVAKVDELMALCDHLEASQTKRESRRDRLVSASLKRIGQPEDVGNGDEFRANVRFHLHHLPRLATRPEHIKELRQTILNLAVRGKLVPQDPNDAPPKDSCYPASKLTEPPFNIPDNWCWATLQTLGILRGGGTPSKSNSEFWAGDIPWIAPKDMKVDYVGKSEFLISDNAIKNSAVKIIKTGSILFVVRGMILAHSFPVSISTRPLTINQDMKALELNNNDFNDYVLRALKGLKNSFLSKVQRSSHGTCRLTSDDYCSILIPLPPQPEQKRIVARVDELMALCDQIETHLKTSQFDRARLLEATLAEALGTSEPPSPKATRSPGMTNAQPERIEPAPKLAPNPHHKTTSTTVQGYLLESPPQPQPKPISNAQEAILAHMQPNQDYTRAQLCDALGLSVYEWNMAIKALKERGEVVQQGEKRGARYNLIGEGVKF